MPNFIANFLLINPVGIFISRIEIMVIIPQQKSARNVGQCFLKKVKILFSKIAISN